MTYWLLERLSEFKSRPAIVWREQPYTYEQLLEGVARWQDELDARRIPAGECAALYGDYSPQTCALLLALIARRHVVVPLTPSVADKKTDFIRLAGAKATFEFDADDAWRFYRQPTADAHPLLEALQTQGDPGLILFTSGSTGESKAALLNLDKLLSKFEQPRRPLCTLTFLLLDHIGGLNTLFYILSSGGAVVSITERSPQAVCRAIERHRVQLLPTTPTFLNMLLISETYKQYDLSSLEMITYGTEPMPASTLRHLNQIFPGVRFKQTYGLSEVGILATQSEDSDSLWLKVGGQGFETKIVDGTLWIRAESAMLGYLNAPSPFDETGWLNTGDAVETNGEYIRILGRTSEIINVGGQKIYPAEIESVLLQMDNIRDVTVRGKANPITGHIIVATVSLIEPEEPRALERRMREFCRGRLAPHQIPLLLEIGPEKQHSERFKKKRSVTDDER